MRFAKAQADRVIEACEAYRRENGSYPPSLEALVPRHLPSVPRARYTVAFGEFSYRPRTAPEGAPPAPGARAHTSLSFTTVAPFGQSFYVFEEKRWGDLD